MTKDDINKLQRYIGKRPQGQSDEQIIAHIEKVAKKTALTEAQWAMLLYPACANADVHIVTFLLGKIKSLADAPKFIEHTLRFRKRRPEDEQKQVEILQMLLPFVKQDERTDVLNSALVLAAWFGELAAAKYLIQAGADVGFVDSTGRSILTLAQNSVDKFNDERVYRYIAALLKTPSR